jgi:hypothetical protein
VPVSAAPLQFGTAGTHTYFSDQSMSIDQHNGQEAASVNDPGPWRDGQRYRAMLSTSLSEPWR